jgi:hypothetical protein
VSFSTEMRKICIEKQDLYYKKFSISNPNMLKYNSNTLKLAILIAHYIRTLRTKPVSISIKRQGKIHLKLTYMPSICRLYAVYKPYYMWYLLSLTVIKMLYRFIDFKKKHFNTQASLFQLNFVSLQP